MEERKKMAAILLCLSLCVQEFQRDRGAFVALL